MTETNWANVVASITPLEPTDLDAIVDKGRKGRPDRAGLEFPVEAALAPLDLKFKDETAVCFGARVTKETPNRFALAVTLAQMAAEKGATPIILSHLDYCGLEQFGFRVERIGGKTDDEREACEAQVRAFWNIVMVI